MISGNAALRIVAALKKNSSLSELRIDNQRHIFGAKVEHEFSKILKDNKSVMLSLKPLEYHSTHLSLCSHDYAAASNEWRGPSTRLSAWATPLRIAFPPGKSRQKIFPEIWGFEIFRFPGNLCRVLGKFFVH